MKNDGDYNRGGAHKGPNHFTLGFQSAAHTADMYILRMQAGPWNAEQGVSYSTNLVPDDGWVGPDHALDEPGSDAHPGDEFQTVVPVSVVAQEE